MPASALIVLVIGALTAATSHVTVVAYLTDIDTRQPDWLIAMTPE